MVPAIRNILGGFLFSGDDVYKKCGVLSGGERTRLAVARMLLRPSNLLLLDEPTNHLDLDSKDVLLDALIDYGGTLIFVSHDRYFVERLATRIIEVGHGRAESFPGTYLEFLWRKEHLEVEQRARSDERRTSNAERRTATVQRGATNDGRAYEGRTARRSDGRANERAAADGAGRGPPIATQRKQEQADQRKRAREAQGAPDPPDRPRGPHRRARNRDQGRWSRQMSAPGFYEDRTAAQGVIDRHQALMWQVGELMHQWEMLAEVAENADSDDARPTSDPDAISTTKL